MHAAAQFADTSRARALGVPFEGTPGPLNAITDVPGVEVGQINIVKGEGLLKVGGGRYAPASLSCSLVDGTASRRSTAAPSISTVMAR
jgi:L-aminopeptidase/D-esterase-like protein